MFHWICLPFILLALVGVELPLCLVVRLFQKAMTCFLESSCVEYPSVLFLYNFKNHTLIRAT